MIAFTHLIEALEVFAPDAAGKEVRTWDVHDGLVFEHLRIWAAGRRGLTSIEHAEAVFTTMDDDTFWSYRHERDLLFAIRDRWVDMSDVGRRSIEARLLTSPIPYLADHDPDEAKERTAVHRLNAIHWLGVHGVAFGFDIDAEEARLLEIAPIWREEFAGETAQAHHR